MVHMGKLQQARELSVMGYDVKYMKVFSEIVSNLRDDVEKDDVVFTMGAGDIWKASYGLKRSLKNKSDW